MAEQELTLNMSLSPEAYATPYQCLVEDPQSIDIQEVRKLAKMLIEQYTGQTKTLKNWRRSPSLVIPGTSVQVRFDDLVNHLMKFRGIENQKLGLPPPECMGNNWMDADVTWFTHYTPINQEPRSWPVKLPLALGPSFPVAPIIDREGFVTTSPQPHLLKALLDARERVIREAPAYVPQVIDRERGGHAAFQMGGTPPLAALMEFLNLYVTIVDITLMQAYYAGYYSPQNTGLRFCPEALGPATGRRVRDKLKWVRLLSGKTLNATEEQRIFNEMKAVRNHLAHFDPPCLAVSIDDVAGWLSKTSALARLLIEIRRCLNMPISGPLVRIAMTTAVRAVPRDPALKRYPQPENAGYRSSTWNGKHPHAGRDPLRVPERLAGELGELRGRVHRVLGRDCDLDKIVEAILVQRITQLKAMDNKGFAAQIENVLPKATAR